MQTVVPLRARSSWSVLPALILALVLGAAVAACCLAIVFGIGVARAPGWTPWLLAIAVAAFAPVPWLVARWRMLRPPARVVLAGDTVTIAYPEILRTPLAVPRALMRVTAVDDDGKTRFRVHTDSSPYTGGSSDGYLWARGQSALPVLVPAGVRPNLALVFETPLAGADVRRPRLGAIYRGERVAGLLVAARDAGEAERVLAPLGLDRPLTMPDVILLDEHLKAPEGGRFNLALRYYVRVSWALVAAGVIVPLVAGFGAVLGAILFAGGMRRHGAALAIAGLAVFGARLALWFA